MPEFPGGMTKFFQYLSDNIKYPDVARKNNVQGIVIIAFTVEKNGKIGEIHVDHSLTPETDAESVRVFSHSPKWIPAIQSGNPVKVRMILPVKFSFNQ